MYQVKCKALVIIALQFLICLSRQASCLKVIPDTAPPYTAANPLDAQYIVSLTSGEDMSAAAALSPGRSWTMADSRGRQFLCSGSRARDAASSGLTKPAAVAAAVSEEEEEAADPAAQAAATSSLIAQSESEHSGQEGAAEWPPARTPFQLLDAMKAMCLYRNDGMWTYEVCYKQRTRQFRQKDQPAKAEDFSCGKYLGDAEQSEAVLEDVRTSGTPFPYVSHTMGGGEKCLLTGQPRTSEVRYTCMREYTDNALVSVREFPTCNYVFTVSTPFLCKHKLFTPPPDPVHVVSCTPIAGGDPTQGQATKASPGRDAAADEAADQDPFLQVKMGGIERVTQDVGGLGKEVEAEAEAEAGIEAEPDLPPPRVRRRESGEQREAGEQQRETGEHEEL